MITVHHLNNSRSQRILWLLEELGLDYQIKFYERDSVTMLAPESLKKIHPLGKSPVLTDGDIMVAESGAIVEYLVKKYDKEGKLRPAEGTAEFLRYTYWLHYAEGSAMLPLLMTLVFSRIEKSPMPFFAKPIIKGMVEKVRKTYLRPQIQLHFDYIEEELKKWSWFAGNQFSAADIIMSFPLEAAQLRAGLNHPKQKEFIEKIKARPAYQTAIKKGGEFKILNP